MTKILFAGHDLKFAQHLIDHYEKKSDFEVKIDKWEGHNIHDENDSIALLKWADIIFCEWGLGNAVWYSNNKMNNQKLIVRMHQQERKTNYPLKFNLDNIDKVIAISPYIYEEFNRVCKIPREKMIMIYNSVDCDFYDLPKRKSSEFNLGIMGILPKSKRLDRAINIFENLYDRDKRYKLYIKGKLPSEVDWINKNDEEREYFNKVFEKIRSSKFKDNIIFDGFGKDTDEWMTKIGFMLSTSDFESFHLAPMEGAASGAFPIILNWDGSDTIYENKWIFENENDASDKIYELSKKNEKKLKDEVKRYVKDNFNRKDIIKEYELLINSLVKE